MTARSVLLVVRWAIATTLVVFAIRLGAAAFRIPLEAGAVWFTPLLLGMAAMSFIGAMALVVPWWRQRGSGASFWAALADIFFPF